MKILPDIYLLSGFAWQRHQNVYGIDFPQEKQLVLIDCGLDGGDLAVMDRTRAIWQLTDRKVSHVFVTHAHFDHAGNASWFEAHGARILAGADGKSLLSGDEHTIDFAYQRPFPVCRKVTILEDGVCVELAPGYRMICHETPGHTAGSVCYELRCRERRIWFTGDFVQTGEQPDQVRLGIKVDSSYSYEQYLLSMRKMKDVESDGVLPGHYSPYLKSGSGLFQAAYRELLAGRNQYR